LISGELSLRLFQGSLVRPWIDFSQNVVFMYVGAFRKAHTLQKPINPHAHDDRITGRHRT
jgi:hypothetical protein